MEKESKKLQVGSLDWISETQSEINSLKRVEKHLESRLKSLNENRGFFKRSKDPLIPSKDWTKRQWEVYNKELKPVKRELYQKEKALREVFDEGGRRQAAEFLRKRRENEKVEPPRAEEVETLPEEGSETNDLPEKDIARADESEEIKKDEDDDPLGIADLFKEEEVSAVDPNFEIEEQPEIKPEPLTGAEDTVEILNKDIGKEKSEEDTVEFVNPDTVHSEISKVVNSAQEKIDDRKERERKADSEIRRLRRIREKEAELRRQALESQEKAEVPEDEKVDEKEKLREELLQSFEEGVEDPKDEVSVEENKEVSSPEKTKLELIKGGVDEKGEITEDYLEKKYNFDKSQVYNILEYVPSPSDILDLKKQHKEVSYAISKLESARTGKTLKNPSLLARLFGAPKIDLEQFEENPSEALEFYVNKLPEITKQMNNAEKRFDEAGTLYSKVHQIQNELGRKKNKSREEEQLFEEITSLVVSLENALVSGSGKPENIKDKKESQVSMANYAQQ